MTRGRVTLSDRAELALPPVRPPHDGRFDSGQILEDGTPERILRDPQEQRTKDFLGAVFEH